MQTGRTELERRRPGAKADVRRIRKPVDSNAKQMRLGDPRSRGTARGRNRTIRGRTRRARLEAEEAEQKIEAEIRAAKRPRRRNVNGLSKSSKRNSTRNGPNFAAARSKSRARAAGEETPVAKEQEAEDARRKAEADELERKRAELQSMQDKIDADRRAAEEAEAKAKGRTVGAGTQDREAREEVEAARRKGRGGCAGLPRTRGRPSTQDPRGGRGKGTGRTWGSRGRAAQKRRGGPRAEGWIEAETDRVVPPRRESSDRQKQGRESSSTRSEEPRSIAPRCSSFGK